MKDKNLSETFNYCSKNELWIVSWYNKVKILRTPFKVRAYVNIGSIKKGEYVIVDEVKLASNGKTVFAINNLHYYYFHFEIFSHL